MSSCQEIKSKLLYLPLWSPSMASPGPIQWMDPASVPCISAVGVSPHPMLPPPHHCPCRLLLCGHHAGLDSDPWASPIFPSRRALTLTVAFAERGPLPDLHRPSFSSQLTHIPRCHRGLLRTTGGEQASRAPCKGKPGAAGALCPALLHTCPQRAPRRLSSSPLWRPAQPSKTVSVVWVASSLPAYPVGTKAPYRLLCPVSVLSSGTKPVPHVAECSASIYWMIQ